MINVREFRHEIEKINVDSDVIIAPYRYEYFNGKTVKKIKFYSNLYLKSMTDYKVRWEIEFVAHIKWDKGNAMLGEKIEKMDTKYLAVLVANSVFKRGTYTRDWSYKEINNEWSN